MKQTNKTDKTDCLYDSEEATNIIEVRGKKLPACTDCFSIVVEFLDKAGIDYAGYLIGEY